MIPTMEIALIELQKAVSDLKQDKETLMRFLKANGSNAKKAEESLRKALKWMKDNNVSAYRHWKFSPAIVEDYKFEYLGLDHDGHPVFYCPIGGWHTKKMMELGYLEESLLFRFYLFELVMEGLKNSQKGKFVIIMDMAGLTYKKCAHYETIHFLGQAFRDYEENYPETLRACYIINAPWAFSYIYNALKHVFSSKTLSKAKIFDSNEEKWRRSLKEKMPENCLPSCYQITNNQLECPS